MAKYISLTKSIFSAINTVLTGLPLRAALFGHERLADHLFGVFLSFGLRDDTHTPWKPFVNAPDLFLRLGFVIL